MANGPRVHPPTSYHVGWSGAARGFRGHAMPWVLAHLLLGIAGIAGKRGNRVRKDKAIGGGGRIRNPVVLGADWRSPGVRGGV